MAWSIKLSSSCVSYEFNDEVFDTEEIELINKRAYTEKSAGYQEPDDDVIEEKYSANSAHGVFTWTVIAKRTGFDTYGKIEDVLNESPNGCDIEKPSFSIERE